MILLETGRRKPISADKGNIIWMKNMIYLICSLKLMGKVSSTG